MIRRFVFPADKILSLDTQHARIAVLIIICPDYILSVSGATKGGGTLGPDFPFGPYNKYKYIYVLNL